MATSAKEIYDALEAVEKTAVEVKELLSKSLYKADPNMPPPPPHAEPDADQSGGPSDMDADNAGTPPPASPEGMEGQEGQDPMEAFKAEVSSMSDEELETMLTVLADEMEQRQASQQAPEGGEGQAPTEQPPAAPQANPEMDALKSENAMMRKSFQKLESRYNALEKSLKAPASKPAATNKPANVMQKTTKEPELLNKSEIISHLETLRKSGTKAINTDLMWYANKLEDSKEIYNIAKLQFGVELPTK
jgi:hypothetical protein